MQLSRRLPGRSQPPREPMGRERMGREQEARAGGACQVLRQRLAPADRGRRRVGFGRTAVCQMLFLNNLTALTFGYMCRETRVIFSGMRDGELIKNCYRAMENANGLSDGSRDVEERNYLRLNSLTVVCVGHGHLG
ncbi:hypothetical protein DPEC_G00196620 [Dallia pectoralis]|uniref:Uncharacterized protein n=1 Tax=Dallia pectoralis TaxID=75939 RepID=A0ACC2G7U4_DALPE|nr:hypothetical protein DPEC_G00196620 [Dallia pectoralis]